MDNDFHKHDINEDEYHLPELEGQNVFGHQQDLTLQRAKRRKLLIIVGAVVAILAAYKLLGLFFSHKTTKKSPTPVTTVTTTTTPQPITNITPAPTISPPSPVTSAATTTTTTDMTTTKPLPIETPSNEAVTKIENQMGVVTGNLNDVTSKLAQLSQRLEAMQTLLQQQQTQPKETVKKVEKVHITKKVHHVARTPRTCFYIQAIIPGRAWLVASNDQTMTVAWGDIIPGYGKVSLIDPVKGVVVTNKGAIIRFRND